MANLLVCTGKKRAVKKVMDYFKDLEHKKKLAIIGSTQRSKKAIIWSYEELKILFQRQVETEPLEIEKKLVASVDLIQIRTPSGVVVKMSTFASDNPEIRWNIISKTTSFQLRGGKVDLREDIHKDGKTEMRTCHLTLAGPCVSVFGLRDLLIKDRIVDSKTLEYVL